MSEAWERFERHTAELEDIASAIRLSHWDQEVMMPSKGGAARARSLATLQAIAHARVTDPEMGSLIDELSDDGSLTDAQAASVRIMKREYDKGTRFLRRSCARWPS
jgi:carboxypeptidase Taq